MWEKLQEWARARGYKVAVGDGALLHDVRQELAGRVTSGELDPSVVKEWLQWLHEGEEPAAAVIAVAVPSPATLVRFTLPDRMLTATIPPSYCEEAGFDEAVRVELLGLLPGLKGDLRPARTAKKAVAARLGLTSYGVNNITYAHGMGSFMRLLVFISCTPIETPRTAKTAWTATMGDCDECGRCRDNCPTGAISSDRFLLRAERCLTAFNERPDEFPPWLSRSSHECLVGCMRCQEVCPRNEGLLRRVDSGITFDRVETDAFLTGAMATDAPPAIGAISEKLATLGMSGYREVIGRNLAALIASS